MLTYVGFTLPFIEALAAKHVGDARTLALTGGAAVACLLIRGVVKMGGGPASAPRVKYDSFAMTPLLYARAQMGLSLAFHIVFAAVGIALPLLMVIADVLWMRTRDRDYLS